MKAEKDYLLSEEPLSDMRMCDDSLDSDFDLAESDFRPELSENEDSENENIQKLDRGSNSNLYLSGSNNDLDLDED